jgi:Ser/Thr protein kinase RdoA (MazF antagonist)
MVERPGSNAGSGRIFYRRRLKSQTSANLMSLPQFVKFHNLLQIVESFCGATPARIRTLDRDSEGFSGAVVLRVVVQDNPSVPEVEYCLRGWPPESLTRERLLGLHRLLEHIHKCGVTQVPVPLRSKFGTTLYAEASQFWQLEPWLPGTADFQADPNDARLRNTMIVLAQWHDAASRFEPRESEATWFKSYAAANSPTVADRLERIERFRDRDVSNLRQLLQEATHLPPREPEFFELIDVSQRILDLFSLSADRVAEELSAYRNLRFRLHPCLRDVWHDHVLFEGDQVTGLIDPSAARSETPATDLARLLGSLLGDDRERWELAIAAYRSVRPLSEREATLARVIDQSTVLLSGLTWLERLFVHRLKYSNSSRVLDRLRQIASRLDRLAGRASEVG